MKAIEGVSADALADTPVEKAFQTHTPDINDQNISDAQMRSISADTMVTGLVPEAVGSRRGW